MMRFVNLYHQGSVGSRYRSKDAAHLAALTQYDGIIGTRVALIRVIPKGTAS